MQGPSSWWGPGVRGLGPWALGSPHLVCLLSWASSQRPFCSSWADIMHYGCRRRWPLRQPIGDGTPARSLGKADLSWPQLSTCTCRLLLPSLSLFPPGPNERWGKICCSEQPRGGDEGDLVEEQLLISAHLLGSILGPPHPLPPASLVYTSWPEPLT